MKCLLCNQEIGESKDPNNPFTAFYSCPQCGKFYVEPLFMRKLELYRELHGDSPDYYRIKEKMKELVKDQVVIFTDDIDDAITTRDDAIYLEFRDILDFLNIFINDISRGSDYGD